MNAHVPHDPSAPLGTSRRRRSRNHATLLLTVASLLAGCGSDPVTVKNGLTPSEVRGLVEVLDAVHTFDLGYDGTNPWTCPEGGSVSYSASYGQGPGLTILIEGQQDFQSCVARSAAGQAFSVGGHLDFSFADEMDVYGKILGDEGSVTGELAWRTNGRAGSCQLDLAETLDSAGRRVSGNACGIKVSQALD